MSEQKLWIVVSNENIAAHDELETAVDQFDNLAKFVVSDSKIVCLIYNPEGKAQPAEDEVPVWSIEEVPLPDIAEKMLEKMEDK